MTQLKVHFSIGDQLNWAVDEDLSLIRQAIRGLVKETDFFAADVIFAAWWAPLLDMDPRALAHKTVICSMHGDPARFLATPSHAKIFDLVDIWLARSRTAADRLNKLGFRAVYVPYGYNVNSFTQLQNDDPSLSAMRSELGNIDGKYLIGNFMRDSEGADLTKPKLVKGPDMLLEIFIECHKRNLPVLPVLAGPRRHWLRYQLEAAGIEYVFIGKYLDDDDMSTNTLDRKQLNLIYNLLDLTIISSRSEGGPLAVCEATAAGCKMIATKVGMVPDVLGIKAIFSTARQAVDLIIQDIEGHILDVELCDAKQRLISGHSIEAIRNDLELLFSTITPKNAQQDTLLHKTARLLKKFEKKLNWFSNSADRKVANRCLCVLTGDSQVWAEETLRQHILHSEFFSISGQSEADLILLSPSSIQDIDYTEVNVSKKVALLAEDLKFSQENELVIHGLRTIYSLPSFVGTIFPSQSVLENWKQLDFPVSRPVLSFPPLPFNNTRQKIILGNSRPGKIFIIRDAVDQYEPFSGPEVPTNYTVHYLGGNLDELVHEFANQEGIFVEAEADEVALSRIRLARMMKIPVVYRQSADSDAIVQFGGVGFQDWADLRDCLDSVASDFDGFLRLGQVDPEVGFSLPDTLSLLIEGSR